MNKSDIKNRFLSKMQLLAELLLINKISQQEYQLQVSKIVHWSEKEFNKLIQCEEKMQIIPIHLSGSYRTGTIAKYTKQQIIAILGFAPNVEDDEEKVVNSWAFMVDGAECAIWDYKGSHHYNMWSVYDPHGVLDKLFVMEKFPC